MRTLAQVAPAAGLESLVAAAMPANAVPARRS